MVTRWKKYCRAGYSGTLQGFSFNGLYTEQIGIVASIGFNGGSVAFSPNSKYMAVANLNPVDTLEMFSMNPFLSSKGLNASVQTDVSPDSLSWSPDNSDIALASQEANSVELFNLNIPSLLSQACGDVSAGNLPNSVSFSPSGKYIAVTNYDNILQVFPFSGFSIGSPYSAAMGNCDTASWSPDGKFIATTNFYANSFNIFPFTGSGIGSPFTVNLGSPHYPTSLSWSPDGRFLAVGVTNSNVLQIYSFNGYAGPVLVTSKSVASQPSSISWSSDGRFIAVVNQAVPKLQIFSFDGNTTLTHNTGTDISIPYASAVSWSPDGRFIAILSYNNIMQIYSFNGVTTPIQIGINISTGATPTSLEWSPDGRFIIVISGGTLALMQIYSFDGATSPIKIGSDIAGIYSATWSKDGEFVAATTTSYNLRVFKANYVPDISVQAISNGVVFGNSNLGSAYDATVNVLAGANVNVNGLLNYDCVV